MGRYFNWRIIAYQQILPKTDGRCAYCGKKLEFTSDVTIDHIIPVSKGGKDEIENLIAACLECNQEKDDKLDFVSKKGKSHSIDVNGNCNLGCC